MKMREMKTTFFVLLCQIDRIIRDINRLQKLYIFGNLKWGKEAPFFDFFDTLYIKISSDTIIKNMVINKHFIE